MKTTFKKQRLLISGCVCILFIALTSLAHPVTSAIGFLRGTFVVHCFGCGHNDIVEGITRNHDCENCDRQTVDGGTGYVVCPDGHATRVEGITESHLCTAPFPYGGVCGKQCRR